MLDFSATDAAFAGFRFVRQHPLIALAWAGIHFVTGVVVSAVLLSAMGPALSQSLTAGAARDPAQAAALFGQLLPLYGLLLLFCLVYYPLMLSAIARAALNPEKSRFAYFRLGMDEVRQLLLMLLQIVLFIAAEIVLIILVAILTASLRMAGPVAGALGAVLAILLALGAFVFLAVRLSLAFPMTYGSRKVSLFRSWSLTRGRFWKMFGTYVLAWALAILVYLLVALIVGALGAAVGVGGAGLAALANPSAAAAFGPPTPGRLFLLGLSAAANALLLPVLLMPMGEIYRQVRPENLTTQLDVF